MKTVESYIIERKLYVTTAFISAYFKTDVRNIRNWTKRGLEFHQEQGIKSNLYILEDVMEWVKENINQTKSNATKRRRLVEIDETEEDTDIEEQINDIQGKIKQANEKLQVKTTQYDEADRISKIMDALTKAVKLGEQTKDLIPKKDTEKVIIEFIATMIAGYKKDIKILPKECAKRDENTIRIILENNYKSTIEKYQKMAKSEIITENKLYNVLEVVFEMIEDDISIDTILEKLKQEND